MIKLSKKNYAWIQNNLKYDEIVIWAGQPYSKVFFSYPWILVTTTATFFISITILKIELGIAFVAVLGFISIMLNQRSLNTLYMITNKRVIFLDGINARKFSAYYPDQLNNFERQRNNDGSGNIILTTKPYMYNLRNSPIKRIKIAEIEDVNKVGDLLDRLAHSTDHCQ